MNGPIPKRWTPIPKPTRRGGLGAERRSLPPN